MRIRWRIDEIRRDEAGFTLPELLTTIAILGILLAIAMVIWLGLLESRRVTAAANQLAADMRRAHSSATNQLTDWRIVLYPDRSDENVGPDYLLVKLNGVYRSGYPTPTVSQTIPRTFPDDVRVVNISGALDTGTGWMVSPSVIDQTRTLEFNTNGTMKFYQAVSGSTCVTVDGDPEIKITVTSSTSRVEVKDEGC